MLVIDCGSPRNPELIRHVTAMGLHPVVVKFEDLKPEHFHNHQGAIISGGPLMISEQPADFANKYAYIKDLGIPILGICFGHQLLGLLHGASIGKNRPDKTEIRGDVEVWLENSRLFHGIEPVSPFRQRHEEHISLPENFVLLGSSHETRVEAMCHRTRPIYGVQFHPESSGTQGITLLENFNKLCNDLLTH